MAKTRKLSIKSSKSFKHTISIQTNLEFINIYGDPFLVFFAKTASLFSSLANSCWGLGFELKYYVVDNMTINSLKQI